MKKGKWIGPTRRIPNYGIFNFGDMVNNLPDNVFNEFKNKKWIQEDKKKPKKKE